MPKFYTVVIHRNRIGKLYFDKESGYTWQLVHARRFPTRAEAEVARSNLKQDDYARSWVTIVEEP